VFLEDRERVLEQLKVAFGFASIAIQRQGLHGATDGCHSSDSVSELPAIANAWHVVVGRAFLFQIVSVLSS
jgi:hypothetical protein